MTRYLMIISYLGTRFRGIQTQIRRGVPGFEDPDTVQGIINIALKKLNPASEPVTCVSSRTDQGVHALRSAIHVDIEREPGFGYKPEYLTYRLNRFFDKNKIAVRIQHCQAVPDTFHSRHNALKRTYLYRLAVRREDAPEPPSTWAYYATQIPFAEWRRCYFIQEPEFDVPALQRAAVLLPGLHNFATFMGTARGQVVVETTRLLESLTVAPGLPLLDVALEPTAAHYRFWDITITARSFLYRQVRRMVGALVAVAQGKLVHEDIERMLAEPGKQSWNPRAVPAPAYGLYLLNVQYDPLDLALPQPEPQPERQPELQPSTQLLEEEQEELKQPQREHESAGSAAAGASGA